MDLTVTTVISGEGASLRSLVDIEDAIRNVVENYATIKSETYPHHRNGTLSFVLSSSPDPVKTATHKPVKAAPTLTTEKTADLQQ